MKNHSDPEIDWIVGKLSGSLSKEEEQLLDKWLKEAPAHLEYYREFEQVYLKSRQLRPDFRPDVEFALQKVKVRKKVRAYRWCRYAAMILCLLGAGLYVFRYTDQQEISDRGSLTLPGSKKAVLYLSAGKTVVLDDIRTGTWLSAGKEARVLVDSNQVLKYVAGTGNSGVVEHKHVLEVPVGGEYQMVLSDGSKVWLNAASRLTYPQVFRGEQRIVELVGEAFFEVKADSRRPFIVRTRQMEVKALGTSFNVKAYGDEEQVFTTLVKGKVKISSETLSRSFLLEPGEQAVGDTQGIEKHRVNLQPYISWIEGKFVFINTRLEEICKQLSRWYDVEVIFRKGTDRNIRFTGAMMKFRPLEDLLNMIQETSSIRFKKEGKFIVVSQ